MLSEIFWTFFISSVCGVLLVAIRVCYKSKCKEVDFCCLKIVRDVDVEEREVDLQSRNNSLKTRVDD
jgi:hypothetical protein